MRWDWPVSESPAGQGIQVLPLTGVGEVSTGDELADLIVGAGVPLLDDDVLVVTSKIVSKAEGRLIEVPTDPVQREAARQAAVDAEAVRVVATRGRTRIVQTAHGLVLAAAGVDNSNVDPSRLVLLPVDPDDSARRLRAALAERLGVRVAVVVTDTMGRPWRTGQTDVAIGAAGIAPLRDHRGSTDPYGNDLSVTAAAVIDELAGAGDLVKGKTSGIPVAVVRGLGPVPDDDGPGAAALVRSSTEDMFALGTAEARAEGRREALAAQLGGSELGDDPVPDESVRRAVAVMLGQAGQPSLWRYVQVDTDTARDRLAAALTGAGLDDGETGAMIRRAPVLLAFFRTEPIAGFDADEEDPEAMAAILHQMDGVAAARDALAAEGLVHLMLLPPLFDDAAQQAIADALELPKDWSFLGLSAAGRPGGADDPDDPDPGDQLLRR